MELVKKNIISVICGAVALIALIAWFWPIGGMYGDLDTALKERVSVAGEIDRLAKTPHIKPVVVESDEGDAEKKEPATLDRFPGDEVIKQGRRVTGDLHDKAAMTLSEAVRINVRGHEPLLPGLLPSGSNGAQKFIFRTKYDQVMQIPIRPGDAPASIADGILHSARPPTDDEIQQALLKQWNEEYKPQLIFSEPVGAAPGAPAAPLPGIPGFSPPTGAAGAPPAERNPTSALNFPKKWAEFQTATKDFASNFRRERATKYKLYMEQGALSPAQNMDVALANVPSVEDIWYAQVALWCQLDVCRSVAAINERSPDIQASPVKHLVSLSVKPGFAMYVVDPALIAPTPAGADAPPPSTEIPKLWQMSPTGRVCNPLYDVVHSELTVVCDPAYVRTLMQMIEAAKFMTVLQVRQQTLDTAAARVEGYDYGGGSAVLVTFQIEHLFLRDWTAYPADALMPPEVRARLHVVPKPPAEPGPAGPVASRSE